MKLLNLLMWVTQFGVSVIFPTLFFLWFGVRLQEKFGFGPWVLLLAGSLGILTSFRTAKSCLQAMRKAAEEASGPKEPPVAFNDHT